MATGAGGETVNDFTGCFMKQLFITSPAGGAEVFFVDGVMLPFSSPDSSVVTARVVVVGCVVVVLVVVAVITVMARSTEEEE